VPRRSFSPYAPTTLAGGAFGDEYVGKRTPFYPCNYNIRRLSARTNPVDGLGFERAGALTVGWQIVFRTGNDGRRRAAGQTVSKIKLMFAAAPGEPTTRNFPPPVTTTESAVISRRRRLIA